MVGAGTVKAPMPTKSGERKALIVGNSRYEYETPLALSGNDADLMERTLLKVGFSVSKFTNLTSDELKGAIRRFCAELSPSDTALVFYSGHSFNTGQMRLVPVDFDFKSGSMQAANEVETKTIPLASVLSALSASGAKPKIVVIDGCRVKFPFTDPRQASPDAQISDTETLLCFATKPDGEALESAALHNSIYTRFLSEEILKPEKRSIEELFRAVTKRVYDATNGLQEPRIYGNLTEGFYFYEGPDEAVSVNTQATPQADNSAIKPVAQSLWSNLCAFMHWTIPKDSAELSTAVVINVTALLSLYLLLVLGIYVIAPSRFVALHEWIANAGIPFSENVSKILGPFLLSTPHCLNAVVGRYRQRARKLFDNAPEVKARPKWVPAPLLIGDQLVQDYQLSFDAPRRKPYVAGMEELQARLAQGDERWTISIEGPGGVGKSALAFEIARWASDSRPNYRLARFPLLPVFLRSLGSDPKKLKNVDEAAGDSLKYIMDVPKISAFLLQAILRRKRALVVVDGISEMPKEAVDALIFPEKGAADSRVLIVTSRSPTNLPDSLVIRPLALNLNFLDRVLDDLVAATVGSGRFSNSEREALRNRVRSLIDERHDDGQQNEVPMIFLRLMIERTDRLLTEKKNLDQLPKTLSELVTDYTEQLLRNEEDPVLAIRQARIAAQVCMGKPRRPAARSENSYTAKGLPRELLDKFVIAGLMVQSGSKSDPFFKFTLDPIAEQLDANRLVIALRDASADQAEIDELVQQWEELPGDFIEALRRAVAGNFDSMPATQPALVSKLWPGEVNPTGSDTTTSIAQGMSANSTPEVNVAQNQFPPLPRFFMGKVFSSLTEAVTVSTAEQEPIFAVIYDSKHRYQSKLNRSLGLFLEYETTKALIRDNFVQALLDVHSPGVRQYVPNDDPLENCLLVVLRPDGEIVRREGVYANPDEGLARTQSILQGLGRITVPTAGSDNVERATTGGSPSLDQSTTQYSIPAPEKDFPPLPRFFVGKVLSSLSEALAISLAEQKPLFAVIYDSKHRSQSKLNYSLGYFLEYETTKNLIRDNFVQALLDVHSPGVRQYVPTDDLLENCLLLVLQPNGNIVRREGVYANPDEGLTRTRSILHNLGSSNVPKADPDHPGEPKATASPTDQPDVNKFSTGQKLLASISEQVTGEQQQHEAKLEGLRQQRILRETTRKESWKTIRVVFDGLWDEIRAAAPDVQRAQGDTEPSLLLQWGAADLKFTPINVDTYTFNQSRWDVLNGYYISLWQTEPRYNWSGNLLLVRLPQDERFRWYEVGYFESPLIQKTRSVPFGAQSPDDYQNADLAASPTLASWQLAFEPIPIEGDHEQSFHDRWMERFAQAALGKLREPQLPLPPPSPPALPAALGVLKLVAATSILVALSEEREALLKLVATDRRTAMKNSWEGLAKDILLAGNIEMGRLEPDSPAVGHALQRLQGNTKYTGKLLVELTGLQITARTLFNQSSFAYNPSDADARQYILRCEEARRELQQSE